MRQDIWTFSGFGELLCIVLAWTVGIATLWADSGNPKSPSGGKVAVSGDRSASSSYYD